MRLSDSRVEPAGEAITFSFDGQPVAAFNGETIAAALVAAGHLSQRRGPDDQRRGVFCGMGICYDCLVKVDGLAAQRACLTTVRAGMEVSGEPLGKVPIDRNDSDLAASPEAQIPEQDCEMLIVGAGPAGLAAACGAAERGAKVLLIDERPAPGGQYFKPLASSQQAAAPLDRQFREGGALIGRARDLGVEILSDAAVWGGFRDRQERLEIGLIRNRRAYFLRPRHLIIASGAYERPLHVPGWTLPGVMTTGAAQTLARSYRVGPGRRVLIAGNGPLNLQVACELSRGGVEVVAVVESAAAPWRRPRKALAAAWHSPRQMLQGLGYLTELRRYRIALLHRHVLLRADGDRKVSRATVARVTESGDLVAGSEREFAVDAVCMGYGFLPTTELARQLGCEHQLTPRGIGNMAIVRDATGATSVPDIAVVGEAGGIGGARVALEQGTLAGRRAAKLLGYASAACGGRCRELKRLQRQRSFQNSLWALYAGPKFGLQLAAPDTLVCRCEQVNLGRLRHLIVEQAAGLGELKRLTRAGMGRCQGRYCVPLLAHLIEVTTGKTPQPVDYPSPRVPMKPLPLAVLAAEKPEWGGHQRSAPDAPSASAAPAGKVRLQADTLVIGAGIVGVCTAYFLARAGHDVLLVDGGDANGQASGANAGSLHVQLLSFDFGSKAEAGGGPAVATLPLQLASVGLWRQLEQELQQDFEIKLPGGLMVAESEPQMEFLRAKIALERAQGIEVELLGRSQLRAREPAISERMLGAAYCPQEGKINPLTATTCILDAALSAGARFHPRTQVTGIARSEGAFDVALGLGGIRCGRVVNAAGAWAGQVARLARIELPVHGAPLQMIVTEPAEPLLAHLVAHADRHLTMKQASNGNLIIGGGWTAGMSADGQRTRELRQSIEGNSWVALSVVPALARLHLLRVWAAMNVNIDGAPVIGEVPGVPGFYNAVSSNGYTLGPLIGQLTADLVTRGQSEWDLQPFAITRFG